MGSHTNGAAAARSLFGKPAANAKGDFVHHGVKYDFLYCQVDAVWSGWQKSEGTGNDGGIIVSWGAQGFGFGQLSLYVKDGVLHCDNETMDREFCATALKKAALKLCGINNETSSPPALESVRLVDCHGKFGGKGVRECLSGGFTLEAEHAGAITKIAVQKQGDHFKLASDTPSTFVVAAFAHMANNMQLDD